MKHLWMTERAENSPASVYFVIKAVVLNVHVHARVLAELQSVYYGLCLCECVHDAKTPPKNGGISAPGLECVADHSEVIPDGSC